MIYFETYQPPKFEYNPDRAYLVRMYMADMAGGRSHFTIVSVYPWCQRN